MQLKTLGKFFKVWYPSLVMMVVIFIMSSFPAVDSDKQSGFIINALTTLFPDLAGVDFLVNIVRKSAHFIEYTVLGFFTARGFKLSKKSPWFSVLASAVYASTDEFHQTFIPGRSGEVGDILIDTAGATLGTLIYWLFNRNKN